MHFNYVESIESEIVDPVTDKKSYVYVELEDDHLKIISSGEKGHGVIRCTKSEAYAIIEAMQHFLD